MQPKWGSRHDEIIKRFEAKKKAGKIKELVFRSHDDNHVIFGTIDNINKN